MEKMRTHPSKKKAILLAAGCLVLAAAVAAVWLFNRPQPGKLYHFQPGEVTQVYLQHYADMRDVTDPAQVEEIVDLLNGFTYQSTRYVPPAGGWSYILDVEGPSGPVASVEFGISTIRQGNGDGSSTIYSGPPGYFRKLVDLAESATDPL